MRPSLKLNEVSIPSEGCSKPRSEIARVNGADNKRSSKLVACIDVYVSSPLFLVVCMIISCHCNGILKNV